jgi:hypothetical protein
MALALAAVLEVLLLRLVAFHPAGGSGNPSAALQYLLSWAALPILAATVTAIVASRKVPQEHFPFMPLMFVCAAGPFFSVIALQQYGHATPGFLALGFIAQCSGIILAIKRVRHAT